MVWPSRAAVTIERKQFPQSTILLIRVYVLKAR